MDLADPVGALARLVFLLAALLWLGVGREAFKADKGKRHQLNLMLMGAGFLTGVGLLVGLVAWPPGA